MNKAACRPPCRFTLLKVRQSSAERCTHHAAFNHIEVSKALLISGMFMPKLALAAVFAAGLAGFSQGLIVSVARSQEPSS